MNWNESFYAPQLKFNALQDDGTLTVVFNLETEAENLLLIITFLTCSNYSLTKFKERRKTTRNQLTPWLRSTGLQHLLVAQDRFIEITSECKPLVRVLGRSLKLR